MRAWVSENLLSVKSAQINWDASKTLAIFWQPISDKVDLGYFQGRS